MARGATMDDAPAARFAFSRLVLDELGSRIAELEEAIFGKLSDPGGEAVFLAVCLDGTPYCCIGTREADCWAFEVAKGEWVSEPFPIDLDRHAPELAGKTITLPNAINLPDNLIFEQERASHPCGPQRARK